MNPFILLRLRLSPAEKKELERLQALLRRPFATEEEAIAAAISSFRAHQKQTGITDIRLQNIYRQLFPGMNADEKRLAQKALRALKDTAPIT